MLPSATAYSLKNSGYPPGALSKNVEASHTGADNNGSGTVIKSPSSTADVSVKTAKP